MINDCQHVSAILSLWDDKYDHAPDYSTIYRSICELTWRKLPEATDQTNYEETITSEWFLNVASTHVG